MARILITGGLGYLGGRLSIFLIEEGHDVVVSSRRSGDAIPAAVRSKIPSIINLKDELSNSTSALFLRSFDCIIHLAALNEHDSAKFPEKAMRVNVGETVNLLNSAIEAGVKRFIYLSTFHVYGAGLNEEIDETHDCRPMHPYSITHKSAEEFVLSATNSRKISGICIRLSNSFGSPAFNTADRWTLLVNDLCMQAIKDKKMVLRSSGRQLRDFITIRDFCHSVSLLLKLPTENIGDGLYNVGSGISTSVLEMTQSIAEVTSKNYGYTPEIICGEGGEENLLMKFNIDKIVKLGFKPENNRKQAIVETLKFCASFER